MRWGWIFFGVVASRISNDSTKKEKQAVMTIGVLGFFLIASVSFFLVLFLYDALT